VNVVINEGGLIFADPVTYSVVFGECDDCPYYFTSIDAGDLEQDGDADLVVGQWSWDRFALLRNAGDGTFGPMEKHNVFKFPWVVEFEDVTGDGHEDFVVLTTAIRSGMRIYFNDGQGNLIEPDHVATEGDQSEQHWRMAAGDVDADGDTDVATVRAWSNVELFEGRADGMFTFRGEFDAGEPANLWDVAMGDLDGDGLADLVMADRGEDGFKELGAVRVALQTAPFQFHVLEPILIDGMQAYQVVMGDMDADGDMDVVAGLGGVHPGDDLTPVDRRILVLSNDGSGNLSPAQEVTFASHTWFVLGALALGDLDGDGDLDAAVASGPKWTAGVLAILTNDGTGTLSIESTMEAPPHPQSIRLCDFDADGSLDLALMCNHNGSPTNGLGVEPYLSIAMNDAKGGFVFTQEFIDINSRSNGQLVAADFDNDGDVDLALPDNTGFVEVHFNDGSGAFGPGARYTGVDHSPALAGADVDNDGRVDLIGANAYTAGLMIFRNRSCPPCAADVNADGALNILDFITFQQLFLAADPAADCDNDGRLSNPADFICFQQQFLAGCK
jgi:hypothetical protein